MADNLSSYTLLVQTEVDDTSTNATSLIQQYIKETYQEVLRSPAGKMLIAPTTTDTAVTPGTAGYTPTTDWMELYGVLYKSAGQTSYNELKEMVKEDYQKYWINSASSTPMYFVQEGLGIRMVPAPVDAGTLRTITLDVQAELTSQDSIIPTRFQNVVKYGAAYRYKAFDDNPAAIEFESYYRKALKDMLMELMTRVKKVPTKFFGA